MRSALLTKTTSTRLSKESAPAGSQANGRVAVRGAGRAYAEASAASKLQHLPHHGADAVVDVVESGVAHEGWGRDHLVLLVHVSLGHAHDTVLGAQSFDDLRGPGVRPLAAFLLLVAHSDLDASEHFGRKHRSDAAQANGLSGLVELLQHALYMAVDLAGAPIHGKCAQVFGGPEAPREDGRVVVDGSELGQVGDLASRNPRRLSQNVPGLALGRLSLDVVNHVHLRDIRGDSPVFFDFALVFKDVSSFIKSFAMKEHHVTYVSTN